MIRMQIKIDGLANKGLDKALVWEKCLITPSCGTGSLSVELSEKVVADVETNAGDVTVADTIEETPEIIHDQDHLKTIIMAASRAHKDNKVIVKAILAEFGAMKLSEVKASDINAVLAKIASGIKG